MSLLFDALILANTEPYPYVCIAWCTCWFAFLYQEKELLEKHNLWLDEELKAKVKNLA